MRTLPPTERLVNVHAAAQQRCTCDDNNLTYVADKQANVPRRAAAKQTYMYKHTHQGCNAAFAAACK